MTRLPGVARTTPLEALRALADKGRALTPAQWQTKDCLPFGIHPKHNASHAMK